jgi:hypothetical protein
MPSVLCWASAKTTALVDRVPQIARLLRLAPIPDPKTYLKNASNAQ